MATTLAMLECTIYRANSDQLGQKDLVKLLIHIGKWLLFWYKVILRDETNVRETQ